MQATIMNYKSEAKNNIVILRYIPICVKECTIKKIIDCTIIKIIYNIVITM